MPTLFAANVRASLWNHLSHFLRRELHTTLNVKLKDQKTIIFCDYPKIVVGVLGIPSEDLRFLCSGPIWPRAH